MTEAFWEVFVFDLRMIFFASADIFLPERTDGSNIVIPVSAGKRKGGQATFSKTKK
jgi:hypothetical protein